MADTNKPLTLQDLQSATGPVGEEDNVSGSTATDNAGHPYGDNKYGKASSSPLKQLGAGKPMKPGTGQ